MSLRQNFLISLFERYSTLVINFVSSIIIARILSPEDIGLFSVAAALLTLAHVIRDFGVGNYLIQEKELSSDKVATVLGLSVVISWSIGIALFLLSPYLAIFYEDDRITNVLRLLSINFFIIPFSSAIYPLLRRELEYGKLYNINVISNFSYAVVAISLAYLGHGFMSLAWASVAGVLVTFVIAQYYRPNIAKVMPSLKEWRSIASFSAINSFTNIVSSLSMQAPELIIGKTLGFAATGIYSRANGIVSMFWTGGISGVLPVIHTEFARRNREGEDLIEIYRKGVSYITVIAWPAFLYMALFSESIIVFLFGDQWDAAAPVASVLAINLMVFALFSMNPNVLLALGKVSDHMKFSVVGDLIRISLIFVAASYSLVHIAYALVISRMIIGVMGSYYVSSHIGIGMWNIVEPSIKSLGIAIGSMILPYYIFSYQVVSENHLLILLGSGFLFSIGWVFLVYLLRHPFSNEIDEMFCRLKDRFRDG